MAFGISPYNAHSNAGMSPYSGAMSGLGFSPMGQTGQMGEMGQSSGLMTGMLQQNQMMTMMMQEMMTMLMMLMSNGAGGASSSAGGTSPVGSSDGGGTSGDGGVSGGGGTDATSSGAGAGAVDASQFAGGTAAGKTLAAAAQNEANAEHSTGFCYRGVSKALHSIGVDTHGESAYMAADQLAQNPKVKEVKIERDQLPSLPPGAIVVWAAGPGHKYGHISVALGGGKEASDHVQSQTKDLTGKGDSYRVFMPV